MQQQPEYGTTSPDQVHVDYHQGPPAYAPQQNQQYQQPQQVGYQQQPQYQQQQPQQYQQQPQQYQPPQPQYQQQQPIVYQQQPQQVVVVQQPQVVYVLPQAPTPFIQPICKTCCDYPGDWCESCCCLQCVIYRQRKLVLAFTGEPYSCCQRQTFPRPQTCCTDQYIPPPRMLPPVWPPAPGTNQMLDEFQPELCLEVCCLPGLALLINRRLMQYKFNLSNTCCESCLMWDAAVTGGGGGGAGVMSSGGGHHGQTHCIGHLISAMVAGCLLTQQTVQFRFEESKRLAAEQGKSIAVVDANGRVVPATTLGSPVVQVMQ